MPTRRPKRTWVYEEWEANFTTPFSSVPQLSVEEREKRWQSMFSRAFVDGKWVVSESDASLVASSGFYLAWEQKEYALAGERARTLNLYPDHQEDWDEIFHGSWSDLAVGNISSALEKFRDLQSYYKSSKRVMRLIFSAVEIAFEAAPDKVDHREIRDLVRNLQPKLSKKAQRRLATSEADSLKGLIEILSSEIYS